MNIIGNIVPIIFIYKLYLIWYIHNNIVSKNLLDCHKETGTNYIFQLPDKIIIF